jgi:hypothetical protein
MLNILKEKALLFILLIIAIGFYVWVYTMWQTCPVEDCSHRLIDNFLRTVGPGSLYLISYFTIFLFLPSRYFNKWFKYIFVWAFPLSVYLVYITTGSSSIPAYGKEDIVKFWGIFYAVVTVLFILIQRFYFKNK